MLMKGVNILLLGSCVSRKGSLVLVKQAQVNCRLADISKNVSLRNLLKLVFGLYDLLLLTNRLLPIFRKTELAAPGLRISSTQCCQAISQQQCSPEIRNL